MPAKTLKAFLDEKKVKYLSISHSKAYTSQEVAALTHVSGKEMAKTVLIKINGNMAMAVLPASYHIDFETLRAIMKTRKVTLASEMEFKDRFPDCEIGAMPPFGNLYNMDVYVAESLAEDEEIAFSAGLHSEIIKMGYKDYYKLVKPHILKFSEKTISFPNDPRERWDVD